jgi:hypothetical protein
MSVCRSNCNESGNRGKARFDLWIIFYVYINEIAELGACLFSCNNNNSFHVRSIFVPCTAASVAWLYLYSVCLFFISSITKLHTSISKQKILARIKDEPTVDWEDIKF